LEAKNVINILLFIGASQGFLLSFALFGVKRGNIKANRILSLLLFLFSLMIFFHTLSEFQSSPEPKTEDIRGSEVVFFLFAPLFYFYCLALTEKKFFFQLNQLIHALPFVLIIILNLIFTKVLGKGNYSIVIHNLIPWMLLIQISVYFYKMIKILRHHKKKIKEVYSTIDKINLDWLKFIIFVQAVIWPISFLAEVIGGDSETWNFVWLLISVIIYVMGYKGFKQPEIFSGILSEDESEQKQVKTKYERSALKEEKAEEYFEKLTEFMKNEKPYLENNITLPDLSKRLKLSTHHLSQIINEKLDLNFYEYINSFRIESAKKLLKDPDSQNFTIVAIAYESGFNSISSFNSVFKKYTGQTPSQYRNIK
jgi:AraC-like DNA-binding protein